MSVMVSSQDNLQRSLRGVQYLFSRFGSDRCSEIAAALTYMSLFALVPLLTVLYTMASAIPAFQGVESQIQELLFQHLLPETSSDIEQYLNDFSRQAKNLTGAGIAFLVATAVLMLRNVERAFNTIWRTRENRSAVSSFLLYWAVLSLAPLTIGMALAISTYLSSIAMLVENYDVIGAGSALLALTPYLLSGAGFTLLYVAVPNCQVPFRHALAGGLIAALAFNVARRAFTDLVVGSSYTFIYGAFAAVPLFLLWIYISWNIVLMGGIFVHSLSAYQTQEEAARPTVLKALDVLYILWSNQKRGISVKESEILSNRNPVTGGLDSETWRDLRKLFLDNHLIAENDRGRYLLARDLHEVKFWQIKELVNEELPLDSSDVKTGMPWQASAYHLLRNQRGDQRNQLDTTLAELFAK